jgi:hypothetical protein
MIEGVLYEPPVMTLSVSEFLCDTLYHSLRYSTDMSIYTLRDKDLVLYVGRSDNSRSRLLDHIGDIYERANITNVGWLVRDNLPASLGWMIDLYTAGNWGCLDAPMAENRAIKELRPCLNVAMNPDPQPLPSRYRREERLWRKHIDSRMSNPAELRRKMLLR